MKKTFVLGVGAQKAGTTWLYEYLRSFEFANFGIHKEYHIWDAVFCDACSEFSVPANQLVQDSPQGVQAEEGNVLRYAMQRFPGVYQGYFASLVADDNKWLTGDITPAYACLSADALLHIKQCIESAGMAVKVVFLMRDPFERCWSAVRMGKRNEQLAGSDASCLDALYKTPGFQFRTNYQKTINELERVFALDDIFYGFYENLFTKSSLDRLSKFLGVPAKYDDAHEQYNASPKSEECNPQLRSEVIDFYSAAYQFCEERFPETKRLWGRGKTP